MSSNTMDACIEEVNQREEQRATARREWLEYAAPVNKRVQDAQIFSALQAAIDNNHWPDLNADQCRRLLVVLTGAL